ncbi:ABC transporter permease subunit [Haloimpatiens lingqiaonensis]|uniref:ABC transporter permease subunit n=1 Tax=Haloimpatiens lingqiaonensis TaxID=1380675 RepID=UPI0010FDF6E6|nr:ABC transporter permease subunit [Haloimpatiens lingqiaonensis]
MNMFLHELKAYRKSTFIWTISLCALTIFFLSMYPTFSKEAVEFQRLLQGFPEPVRKAFGFSGDISSFLNFYSYIFLYVVLCGAIQAMNLGISILSKEVREKTADFLFTKPVTRKQIITSKLFAAFTSIVITNIVYLITASIMVSIVKEHIYSIKIFNMISITLFFIQLVFMSLGIFIAVVVPKIKSVISVSLSAVFAFFIIGMFQGVIESEVMRYITPFKYFDTAYIIKNGQYEVSFIVLAVLVIMVTISASYYIYWKRDIQTV